MRRYLDLKKKTVAGDATVKLDIAILECTLGLTEFYELEEAVEGQELTAAQRKAVELCRVNAAVAEGAQLARAGGLEDVKEEFAEIYKKGVLPTQRTFDFWAVLVQHAYAKGDAAMLEESIKQLKEIFGPGNEGAKRWLARFETRLAELKGAEK